MSKALKTSLLTNPNDVISICEFTGNRGDSIVYGTASDLTIGAKFSFLVVAQGTIEIYSKNDPSILRNKMEAGVVGLERPERDMPVSRGDYEYRVGSDYAKYYCIFPKVVTEKKIVRLTPGEEHPVSVNSSLFLVTGECEIKSKTYESPHMFNVVTEDLVLRSLSHLLAIEFNILQGVRNV